MSQNVNNKYLLNSPFAVWVVIFHIFFTICLILTTIPGEWIIAWSTFCLFFIIGHIMQTLLATCRTNKFFFNSQKKMFLNDCSLHWLYSQPFSHILLGWQWELWSYNCALHIQKLKYRIKLWYSLVLVIELLFKQSVIATMHSLRRKFICNIIKKLSLQYTQSMQVKWPISSVALVLTHISACSSMSNSGWEDDNWLADKYFKLNWPLYLSVIHLKSFSASSSSV